MIMRMSLMKIPTLSRLLGCFFPKRHHFLRMSYRCSSFFRHRGWSLCLLSPLIFYSSADAASRGDPAAGKLKIETCLACHGKDGVGISPSYPSLGGQSEAYLIKQITDIRDGHRKVPEMTGMVDKLTDQDIADIAAWYASQPKVSGVANGKPFALGWQLFNGGSLKKGISACAGCHSPTGAGIVSAGFPSLEGQSPQYLIKQLTDFREGHRSNDINGIMQSVAEKLSNKEIEALANYMSGLYQ